MKVKLNERSSTITYWQFLMCLFCNENCCMNIFLLEKQYIKILDNICIKACFHCIKTNVFYTTVKSKLYRIYFSTGTVNYSGEQWQMARNKVPYLEKIMSKADC